MERLILTVANLAVRQKVGDGSHTKNAKIINKLEIAHLHAAHNANLKTENYVD